MVEMEDGGILIQPGSVSRAKSFATRPAPVGHGREKLAGCGCPYCQSVRAADRVTKRRREAAEKAEDAADAEARRIARAANVAAQPARTLDVRGLLAVREEIASWGVDSGEFDSAIEALDKAARVFAREVHFELVPVRCGSGSCKWAGFLGEVRGHGRCPSCRKAL